MLQKGLKSFWYLILDIYDKLKKETMSSESAEGNCAKPVVESKEKEEHVKNIE